MARMIPGDITKYECLSFGEQEVFEALKVVLSDEWIVIYSLR